jgi:succinoglycan biosynthesis transport protein ExoP
MSAGTFAGEAPVLGSGNQLKPWLDVLYRRRYWLLVPALLGLLGGVVTLSQMPKLYHASTMILITPELVSDDFVYTTVSSKLEERIATLGVSVTSRSYLEPIAREMKLVGPNAREAKVAAACDDLAQAIRPEFDMARPPKWFKIHVEHSNPVLAAGVANSLAARFIEQNKTLRESQASAALEMAQNFLADTRKKLDAKLEELARYKSANLLTLPDQSQTNFQLMMTAQNRVTQIDNEIRAQTERITMLQAQAASLPAVSGAAVPVSIDPAVDRYRQLQRELYDLELKYNDAHPDVLRKRDELQSWAKANPQVLSPPAPAGGGTTEPAKPATTMIDVQIAAAQRQIQQLQADRARYEAEAGAYQSRVTSVPAKQQELEMLTRDLSGLQADYNEWMSKKAEAERSLALEDEHQNAQFKIQDEAKVPGTPYKPIPLQVILTGLGVGLALGAATAFILEFIDNSVRTEEEFATAFPDLPLLAAIPDLDRAAKGRKRKGQSRRAAAAL